MHTISTLLRIRRVDRSSSLHVNNVEAIIGNVVSEVGVISIFNTRITLGHWTNFFSWGGAVGLITVDDGVLSRVSGGRSAAGTAGVCTWGCSW